MLSVEDVTFPNKMLLHSRSQERVLTNKSNIGWKEMTLRIFLEVLDVFIVALRIITFGFIQDKNYRKFKSKKDRFLNPVHLYPELYKDVFVESLHQVNKEEAKNPFVCYMMIGKEALPAFVELLQQSVELNFCNSNSIKLQLDEKVSVIFQNQPFCVGLVKMTIPFITKVCFNDCGNDEAYFLFFETLSKEQRQEKLTIVGLKHVNKLIIEGLQKLNDKGVSVNLENPSKEVLTALPKLKLNNLKIQNLREWIDFLLEKPFSCSFSKLDVPFVKSSMIETWRKRVIDYVDELSLDSEFNDPLLYTHLKKTFPNVNKLTINAEYECYPWIIRLPVLKTKWSEVKNIIENAPQLEIVVNYKSSVASETELMETVQFLNLEKIDEETFRWTSEENKFKMMFFHFGSNNFEQETFHRTFYFGF